MKKKILFAVSLSLFFLAICVANSQARLFSFQLPRNNTQENNAQENNTQKETRPLLSNIMSRIGQDSNQTFLPVSDNEASMEWIRKQMDTILDRLQEEGAPIPADMKWNMEWTMDDFFALALNYLMKTEKQFSLPGANLFGDPDYDLIWNYDQKTKIMDFIANHVLSNELGFTSVDLGGRLNLNDPDGLWNIDFSVVNNAANRDRSTPRRAYLQRPYARLGSASQSQTDTSKNPGTGPPWQIIRKSEFTLMGRICQDGLVSLYMNPCQIINMDLNTSNAYTTKSGIEVLQDGEVRSGVFYVDILSNSVSGTVDNKIWSWEMPLW